MCHGNQLSLARSGWGGKHPAVALLCAFQINILFPIRQLFSGCCSQRSRWFTCCCLMPDQGIVLLKTALLPTQSQLPALVCAERGEKVSGRRLRPPKQHPWDGEQRLSCSEPTRSCSGWAPRGSSHQELPAAAPSCLCSSVSQISLGCFLLHFHPCPPPHPGQSRALARLVAPQPTPPWRTGCSWMPKVRFESCFPRECTERSISQPSWTHLDQRAQPLPAVTQNAWHTTGQHTRGVPWEAKWKERRNHIFQMSLLEPFLSIRQRSEAAAEIG